MSGQFRWKVAKIILIRCEKLDKRFLIKGWDSFKGDFYLNF